MHKLSVLLSAMVLLIATTVQSQSYQASYAESSKCYGQCLIPGDVIKTTEKVEIKPGWKSATVSEIYPSTVEVPYITKEACSTCNFKEENSVKTEEVEVIIKPGYWKYTTTPCVWKTVYDTIVVREKSVKYEITDPTFKSDKESLYISGVIEEGVCTPAVQEKVKKTVVVAEACTKIEVADYIWEDETFTVEVKAPTQIWVKRKSDNNCLSDNPDDCLVWCLVDVPGETETCTRQVNKGCPYGYTDNGEYCVKKTEIPAKTKTVEVTTTKSDAQFHKERAIVDAVHHVDIEVLDKPATLKPIIEEAKYEIVARQVIVKPATIDSVYVQPVTKKEILSVKEVRVTGTVSKTPEEEGTYEKVLCEEPEVTTKIHEPEYKTVTKIKVNPGTLTEWKEILCPADINAYTIGQIQYTLSEKGYATGPVDEIMGEKTKAALVQYQRDNGLPVGQLDLQTIEALGVKYQKKD